MSKTRLHKGKIRSKQGLRKDPKELNGVLDQKEANNKKNTQRSAQALAAPKSFIYLATRTTPELKQY